MILRVRTYRLDSREPRVAGAGLLPPKSPHAPGPDAADPPAEAGGERGHMDR